MKKKSQALELSSCSIITDAIFSFEFHDDKHVTVFMPSNSKMEIEVTADDKAKLLNYITSKDSNYAQLANSFINADKIIYFNTWNTAENWLQLNIMFEDGSFSEFELGQKIINSFLERLKNQRLPLMWQPQEEENQQFNRS